MGQAVSANPPATPKKKKPSKQMRETLIAYSFIAPDFIGLPCLH